MNKPHVMVIGAGIVGVASALWLQREGFAVTLVESGGIGEGASFGNAGNLSPGSVVPFTMPGVLREAPGWLLDKDGPLVVRPSYFLKVAPFLFAAARSSRTEAALKTSKAMRELHRTTFEAYDVLTRGTEAESLIERCGQLYVSQKIGGAHGSLLSQFMREAAGVKTQFLSASEIRELEPTLAPGFISGMLIPDNGRTKNPNQLVRVLAAEAERNGATLIKGRVTDFEIESGQVRTVLIDGKPHAVERVLVAAGAASGKLSAKLGTAYPIEPERGYHITVVNPEVMPRTSVSNIDGKFVAAPMNMGLRFAGTVEYAGFDASFNDQRAQLLERQAKQMFPKLQLREVTRWAGERPTLSDGLPVLGKAPKIENAYFAFGNSHYGMSAGPVMGRVITQIIAGRPADIDTSAFSPARFETAST